MEKRTIAILGATGSIGTQALDIVSRYPDRFHAVCLTADRSSEKLFELVRRFRPACAALNAEPESIPEDVRFCQWFFGPDSTVAALRASQAQDALCAIVGIAGLDAVWAALDVCQRVLLANKEALVAGGQIVMSACADGPDGPTLIPVDSEHSAIYQCLRAAQGNAYEKILLTASGGAFRDFTLDQLKNATLAQALTHPNWSMGAKITVDSASMFNKALEIIEARWLFDARPEQIEVLIHPQSIVHSMVQFRDGAVLAQLGAPDMRVPIAYAMAYPQRIETAAPKADFPRIGQCTFTAVDPVRFPAVGMAYEALRAGGAACCMLNAANEEANARFRAGGLGFMQIGRVVEETLARIGNLPAHTIEEVYAADAAARREARQIMERMNQE